MPFDIDQTLKEMLDAAKDVLGKRWKDAGSYAERILRNHLTALKELAALRLANDIDDTELKSELDDEKKTLEAELLALKVLNKAIAQKAANAATRAFFNAVRAAIRL